MQDPITQLETTYRPKTLLGAARHALPHYSRTKHLPKFLGDLSAGPRETLMRLMDLERDQNAKRLSQSAEYDVTHHLILMTAILAEARDQTALPN